MEIKPLGVIRSCFKDTFAIPRQAGLCQVAEAKLVFQDERVSSQAFDGLVQYSHVWVIFGFHQLKSDRVKQKVRPPRLGGEKAIGTFATRSPYRPNPLGLSAVLLVDIDAQARTLTVQGGDFLDGTPIFDVKPYLPYADCLPEAKSADFVRPQPLPVRFAAGVKDKVSGKDQDLIVQVLQWDPRPAVLKKSQPYKEYRSRLKDFDVRWGVDNGEVVVFDVWF